MKLEHLSGLLLRLHSGTRKLAIADFREWALQMVKPVLQFDSALWGRTSRTQPFQLSAESLHRHGHMDLVALAERACAPEGAIVRALTGHPGITVNLSLAEGESDGVHEARAPDADAPGSILHVLCTGIHDAESRTCSWLAVFRNDPAGRFSERERLLKHALTPHLMAAWSANRAWYLAQLEPDRPERRQSWAIVDRRGAIQDVTPRFRSTVSSEWPEWDGSQLPPGVVEPLLNAEGTRLASARLLFESFPIHNLYFVKVRQKKPSDCLSSRERLVAQLFCEGLTYKEIAKRLAIAPTTVRAHLRGIYSKLGVTSKLGLIAALS